MFSRKKMVSYKGYDITFDKDNDLWFIRKTGPHGLSVGTSPDLAEAKRCIDALVKIS